MASHPNKGEGLRPLPTPQAKAAFIGKLLAELPKGERRDLSDVQIARQVREDRAHGWNHALRLLEAAHRALQVADHERLRWSIHEVNQKKPPASLVEAERRSQHIGLEVYRLLQVMVYAPIETRAQALDKRKAYDRFSTGVSIDPKVRNLWKAAMDAELARYPKQERPRRREVRNAA